MLAAQDAVSILSEVDGFHFEPVPLPRHDLVQLHNEPPGFPIEGRREPTSAIQIRTARALDDHALLQKEGRVLSVDWGGRS